MKNRSAILALVAATALALSGCSAVDSASPDRESSPEASSAPAIEVDEAIATVDVRIARTLIDQESALTDQQIIDAAADQGLQAAIDGDAVVYTMTRTQQADMLAQMRSSARDAADGLVADDTNSVTAVEFDDSMTSFKVRVDGERYGSLEGLLALGFYMQGALFQQFSGVGVDEIDVIVDFVDDATGEVLNSGSYQDMRERLQH